MATSGEGGGVVKAQDIAPRAFGGESGEGAGEGGALDGRVDDLDYDLHHLAAFDTHPIDLEKFQADPEGYLGERTLFATQGLITRLFDLQCSTSEVGPIAELPRAITILPREKPLPAAKKETKWEKFAAEKGIKKKKKSRMVWDEMSQEWRPRWGYKRANGGVEEEPIVEIKEGDDPYADPWTEAKAKKKARVAKNIKQQQDNRGLTDGLGSAVFGLPVDMRPGKVAGVDGPSTTKPIKKGKEGLTKSLVAARRSTASMGKFDQKIAGEPELKSGSRRKAVGQAVDKKSLDDETEGMRKIFHGVIQKVDPMVAPSPRHVNIDALEPERAGYKRKKGRGGGGGASKKKTKK